MRKFVICNEGMEDITKIVNYLEVSNILIKVCTKLIIKKQNKKKLDLLVHLGYFRYQFIKIDVVWKT